MKRYYVIHPYGGIATEVGTFNREEIEDFFGVRTTTIHANDGKVFDFPSPDGHREVLIYATPVDGEFRVVCINRTTDEQMFNKSFQTLAKNSWLTIHNNKHYSTKVGW